MSDKLKRGRKGTEKFFKKHKDARRKKARASRFRTRGPSRYDPDTRY